MAAGVLREVAVHGQHRLMSDGWAYYDVPKGATRLRAFIGYFEHDAEAVARWLDMLGVRR